MQDPGVSPVPSRVSRSNRIALCCLVLALAGFVLFHVLPWFPPGKASYDGWKIWKDTYDNFLRPNTWDNRDLLATTGFLTSALVFVSGPFLLPVLRASRPAWWLFMIVSILATITLSGLLLFLIVTNPSNHYRPPGIGMICFMASQSLHLIGLLFIRRPGATLPQSPCL